MSKNRQKKLPEMIKEELLLSLLENVYKKESMLTAINQFKRFESLKIRTYFKDKTRRPLERLVLSKAGPNLYA